MNIRKQLFFLRTLPACMLAVVLALPCAAGAVSIGDAVVLSGAGGPLLAQVELLTGRGERIEEGCLSLLAPEPSREDSSDFLSEAKLSLKADGKRQYVNISSLAPLNSVFVKLRLQIQCPGTPGVIKTLTLAPAAKLTPEELALLLEQQKLLVVSTLAMQHQIKLLQEELAAIKLQLAQSGINPAAVAASAPLAAVPQPAAIDSRENQPGSVAEVKPLQRQAGSPYFKSEVLVGLALLLLVLWLGLRFYTKTARRQATHPQPDAAPIQKPAEDVAEQKLWVSPGIKRPTQFAADQAPSNVLPPKAGIIRAEAATAPPSFPKATGEKKAEADLLLEEAELYANNGHPIQAVTILLDIIKRFPSKVDAWTLLLSLYSALGKVAEFEIAAREFLRRHQASPAWSGIQALGRTLNHDNPLYADQNSHGPVTPALADAHNLHHPIGDVLIEQGILSQREISAYLNDFKPAKHGRFGGYLVARKAITLAQLDQALLQQQGMLAEAKPDTLPSLQDIENFLESFDPKRHGSVAQFMAAHNAVTPEQLGQLLQQQSKQGAAAKHPQAAAALPFDQGAAS